MNWVQLHEIAYLPTGKIVQPDPDFGILRLRVYQRVKAGQGNLGVRGSVGLQEREHVIPFDPKTPAQMAQRNKLAMAVAAWLALVEPEKRAYRLLANDKGMTGYQYYVGQHIKGYA